ncbi:MAG: ester cyclase [Deltaproteobacteria bacterium]|nr:ester cyclase [Deltaproteobacteria bacterium]
MTEKNKEIVRQFIETVINNREESQADQFISPDYIDHNSKSEKPIGIDGLIQHIHAVRSTYPDLKIIVHDQVAEDDMVVSRISITGTHEGNWLRMKPTHKQVAIDAVNINRIKNGLIVEHWGVANTLEALLDIGAIKLEENEQNT